MRIGWIVMGLTLLASTASAQRGGRRCADTPVDSSTAGEPIYHACHVDRVARERGDGPDINWSPGAGETRNGACFRAEFEFVVDTLGVPELGTVRVVSSSNMSFTQAVQASLPAVRYTPARLGERPVRQMVTYRRSVGLLVTVQPMGSSRAPSARPPRC